MFFIRGFLGMTGASLTSGILGPLRASSLTVAHRFRLLSSACLLSSHEPSKGMILSSILQTLNLGSPCVSAYLMFLKSWR